MSESDKTVFYFDVVTKERKLENNDCNDSDIMTREALIKDLTSESITVLEDVHSGQIERQASLEVYSKHLSEEKLENGKDYTAKITDSPTRDRIYTNSVATRQDHDYSEVQVIHLEKTYKSLAKNDPMSGINNSLSHRENKSKELEKPKEKVISRVKNISELKRVTPSLKIMDTSPSLTALPKIKVKNKAPNQKSTKNDSIREQLKKYCRTCAGLKLPLVDIFSEKGRQMRLNQQMKHLEDIKQYGSLSTQMCMDCICDLKMSYKFFMQIKKAQVKLQSICTTLKNKKAASSRETAEEERSCPAMTNMSEVSERATEIRSSRKQKTENCTLVKTEETESPMENRHSSVKEKSRSDKCYTVIDENEESIEEFDPEDPSLHSDHSQGDGGGDGGESLSQESENRRSEKLDCSFSGGEDISQHSSINVDLKPEMKNHSLKMVENSKVVYKYDPNLKAYVKVEPPESDLAMDEASVESEKEKFVYEPDAGIRESCSKQPNILKRKISSRKNFFESPVAYDKPSDSTYVRSGRKEIKKPKLNVKNAVNSSNENEDGIMYVTVKGTKPNELLLVKVKKMEKASELKKEEKKKSSETVLTEKVSKTVDVLVKKEVEFQAERAKVVDKREQKIAEEIEEYKKKREKILGGSAGVQNTLKFEDGMIRFVNPVESAPSSDDNENVRVKLEPNEEAHERADEPENSSLIKGETSEGADSPEVSQPSEAKSEDSEEAYENAGEYLTRLAKLKRKWEEAKRRKEALRRELFESYNKGNMDKLVRILGEREKNLAEFQEYLKQRKIVITRLKDEDVISLYEDCHNITPKKNFPDLIDASTPIDYIEAENYLECDYCPETFAERDVLEEHLKTHDYKLMYWCEDCNMEFPTVKSKRAHNGDCLRKLICRYCELVLESKGKKRQHEQKHVDSMYGQMCDVCGEKFKHQATLDQHFKTQHMTWEKKYQCSKCPKKFAFKQKLTFHVKSVHTTLRAWLCEDCGADFKNPASLRHHRMRKHHPTGNKRECPVCSKLVPFYSLSKHMYTHKAYTIQCPHCDKMFKNSSTLKQHLRIHENQRQYRCDTCGVGFNRRDGLKLHMRVHQKSDSRALKECSCQICSEKFPNHSMLVIHRNRVHKDGRQYTCHICNRSMLSTRSLEWHMSHIHNESLPGSMKSEPASPPEKKRVSCLHCDKTFKTEMILRTHIKNTHIEKNPTKCLDCEQTFTSDVRLRHHMMIAHNRLEGTLTCPHCPKRFVNQLRLKTHMISHSEDRPYTCEICGFNLKTKIQLIKHHQNRHSDERPLQCRYCPWRCKQASALVCHERTHTNERPYSCVVCRQRFKYLGDKNKHERRHESLGGSGFKRIVVGRNVKPSKSHTEETSTSEQDQPDYDNQDDEEHLIEEQHYDEHQNERYDEDEDDDKYHEETIVKFEAEDMGEEYEQNYEQEYEETSREASEAAEVIMNMEDTTVYTEEVTADNIETAEMINDELITNEILQPDITVVHLQQQDDSGKIQVIPVMLSLPDLSDSGAEVNLATASIMYNN